MTRNDIEKILQMNINKTLSMKTISNKWSCNFLSLIWLSKELSLKPESLLNSIAIRNNVRLFCFSVFFVIYIN